MPLTTKLVAVAASAVVLAGGVTATVVTASAAPAPATVATPAAVSTTEVRVWANGTAQLVSVPQATVAAALSAADITLGPDDRVSLPMDKVLTAGDSVTVTRVTVTEWSKNVTLAFSTTEEKDATLAKGKTKVKTEGVDGQQTDIVETVTEDGTIVSQDVVSSTVISEPVGKVVLVGTRVEPKVDSRSTERTATSTTSTTSTSSSSGGSLNTANAAMWDRIATCESGNNWSINTGNGYYGGLQFSLSTWKSVNGTDFAAYPHQASREEQITVANRLYAQRGLQPWGCAHAA